MKKLLFFLSLLFIVTTLTAYEWYSTPYRMSRIGFADEFSRDTIFINPAVIPYLEKRSVFSMMHTEHTLYLTTNNDGTGNDVFQFFQPFEKQHGISLSIRSFNSNSGYSEFNADLAYGIQINSWLTAGFQTSVYSQSMQYTEWPSMIEKEYTSDTAFRLTAGMIAKVANYGFLSVSAHDLFGTEVQNPLSGYTDTLHPSVDIGFSSFTRYGNIHGNCYLFTDELEESRSEISLGYAYPLFNKHITPSVGITFGKMINTGLSVQYKYLSFAIGYGYNYTDALFRTITFSIGLKFKNDWYSEYRDVHVFSNEGNFFHFIVLTNHELKKSDTWLKVEQNQSADESDFGSFYIKTSIPNEEIKYAYMYVKIPKKWVEARSQTKEGITLSVIIDGKREEIPLFYLYDEPDYYYYMGITKKL